MSPIVSKVCLILNRIENNSDPLSDWRERAALYFLLCGVLFTALRWLFGDQSLNVIALPSFVIGYFFKWRERLRRRRLHGE